MPLFTLTVSLDDLGLDVVADEVVEVTKNRLLLVDAYPPVNNLYKIREVTDVSGLVEFELEPDDDSTFHKITIHDLENVLIYERIFIMPSFTVAIEDTDPSFSSSTIQIQSSGTNLGTPYTVSALNFIGAVLALASGTVTLTITPTSIGADVSGAAATAEQAAKDYADDGLALKLDAADYVQHFLGKYSSLGALQTAHATATDGDYAIVDTGSGSNARQYVWDLQEGWVDSGDVKVGTTTDQLAEGATNLFFTSVRALAATQEQIDLAKIQSIIVACSDRTTALTAGTNKFSFPMPYDFTLTAVKGYLTTPQASGAIFTVDINHSGSTILSTKLTIDNAEQNSINAATQPVISNVNLLADTEVVFDFDQVGDGTAKGLIITFIGTRT